MAQLKLSMEEAQETLGRHHRLDPDSIVIQGDPSQYNLEAFVDKLRQMREDNERLGAIKLFREQFGTSLLTAKIIIESLWEC
mgnify:CR=1 FL=1